MRPLVGSTRSTRPGIVLDEQERAGRLEVDRSRLRERNRRPAARAEPVPSRAARSSRPRAPTSVQRPAAGKTRRARYEPSRPVARTSIRLGPVAVTRTAPPNETGRTASFAQSSRGRRRADGALPTSETRTGAAADASSANVTPARTPRARSRRAMLVPTPTPAASLQRNSPTGAAAQCRGAPVAQWIEQRFPKPRALVRFRPGALSFPHRTWPIYSVFLEPEQPYDDDVNTSLAAATAAARPGTSRRAGCPVTNRPRFDPYALFEALERHCVGYVVIGGFGRWSTGPASSRAGSTSSLPSAKGTCATSPMRSRTSARRPPRLRRSRRPSCRRGAR